MNTGEIVVSSGALSSALLEGIKFLWRKFVVKDMAFDFPTWFYVLSLPLLNAVMPFVMVFLGVPVQDPILTMNLSGVARYLALILISSLVSLATNTTAIQPLRRYNEGRQAQKSLLTGEK